MPNFYQTKGILHQFTCVATLQHNVLAERKHQHILNVARAFKFQSSLPMKYWNDFVLTVVHLINWTPTPLLDYKSPLEMLSTTPSPHTLTCVFLESIFRINP